MIAKEQAAELRWVAKNEYGMAASYGDALEAGAHALDLLAMAEGAEALEVDRDESTEGGRWTILYRGSGHGSTQAEADRALAARLLATALRLVEGT